MRGSRYLAFLYFCILLSTETKKCEEYAKIFLEFIEIYVIFLYLVSKMLFRCFLVFRFRQLRAIAREKGMKLFDLSSVNVPDFSSINTYALPKNKYELCIRHSSWNFLIFFEKCWGLIKPELAIKDD